MTVISTLLDNVLDETGFAKPSSYFGNSAQSAVRARTLANASVRDLLNINHRGLVKEATITLSAATLYDLPADFYSFIPDTMYEDNDAWPADFPSTDQEFAWVKFSGIGSGAFTRVRAIGNNQIEVFDPDNGQDLKFSYRSNHPILATDGTTTKPRYTADTDTWELNDDLHVLDIIWRWRKLHGMDYQDDLALFKRFENNYRARDGGARSLNFGGGDKNYRAGAQADYWVD